MIKLSIGQLIGMYIGLTILGIILYNTIKHFFQKKQGIIYCNYNVISKSTGEQYECYAIRQNGNITECKIWNMYSKHYEWYPISHFTFYE